MSFSFLNSDVNNNNILKAPYDIPTKSIFSKIVYEPTIKEDF